MRMVNLCKNKLFNTGLMLLLCLSLQAQNKEMRRVATNDCGVTNTQAFLIKGDDYTLPDSFTGSKRRKPAISAGRSSMLSIRWIYRPITGWRWSIWLTTGGNSVSWLMATKCRDPSFLKKGRSNAT